MSIKNLVRIVWVVLIITLFSACEKCNFPEPEPQVNLWDRSHQSFTSLKGAVNNVLEASMEDGELYRVLEMRFNADGMLTYYNPVLAPVEPAQQSQIGGITTYGWGVAQSTYQYSYDDLGQINSVQKSVDGEIDTYIIKYGLHGSYVPLPFAIGDMNFFLVKNITEIKCGDKFIFTCDGKVANYEVNNGWSGVMKIHYEFNSKGYPSQCIVTTTKGGEEQVATTIYTWGLQGALKKSSTQVIITGYPEGMTSEVIEYAGYLLHKPLKHTLSYYEYSDTDEPKLMSNTLYYDYDIDGNLLEQRYGVDESGFEEVFKTTYSGKDTYGNWTKKTKSSFDGDRVFDRTISYFGDI